MPEPIIDPITSAVELNSPSVCAMRGASADAVDFGAGARSGVGIETFLADFYVFVSNIPESARFRGLPQLSFPPPEFHRRIGSAENGGGNSNGRSPSGQHQRRGFQGDA